MIVQIYEVATRQEAAICAAAGVDHIGVLVGNGAFPREVAPSEAVALFQCLPEPALACALSLSADMNEIAKAAEIDPGILHLGAAPEKLSVSDVAAIRRAYPALSLMRSIPVTGPEAIELARDYDGAVDFLLLDSHDPGDPQIGALGRTHDWSVSRRIVEAVSVPCILAGGLGPENVENAIRAVRPAGVDSKTKTDLPGSHQKDPDRVRLFVEGARQRPR